MKPVLIGSRAARIHFPSFREPSDVDWFGKKEDIDNSLSDNAKVESFYHPYLEAHDWTNTIASPNELYTIKVSHAFWNNRWPKHIRDIEFFQSKGCELDKPLFDLLYLIWTEHYGRKRARLPKGTLAADGVEETWMVYPNNSNYSVSNTGKLRGPRGVTSGVDSTNGYVQFTISGKTISAHTVVAETYLGPRPEGLQILHYDGDPKNNRVGNLRYGSPKENAADKERHGTTIKNETHPLSKLTMENAREIRRRYSDGGVTQRQLASDYGVAQSLVGRILSGEAWPENSRGFFTPTIQRKYMHDSLHASVAYHEEPLFKMILRDGEAVAVDKSKFDALEFDVKCQLVREEVYATALERKIIPSNYTETPLRAYRWALQETVTSYSKGWFPLWVVENIHAGNLTRPDVDYVQRHHDNSDRLIVLEK